MAKFHGQEIWYDWGGLNEKLFYALNGLNENETISQINVFITDIGRHQNFYYYLAVTAFAAMLNLFVLKKSNPHKFGTRKNIWLMVIFTMAICFPIERQLTDTLKLYFAMPRPFIALPKSTVFAIIPDVNIRQYWMSFPSGHSAFAMFMGAALWPALNRYGKVIIGTLVLLIGISRVILGMHFPADVAGGFTVALLLVVTLRFAITRLFARKPKH